ncbi:nuclear transport factor 2 family protein [Asticcacaulis solisilvae]|uniref:nuclear transport factor 2 family protein n=1 Tax=Asticcacaulis solisilvae TaxID=1217274 RepID=UPI003FD8EB1C
MDFDRLAETWYAAWNARDLDAIMALYADDVRFTSPYVRTLEFAADGTLTTKFDLERYFALGLSKIPNLHFTPVVNCISADSHTMVYRNQSDAWVTEMHEYDGHGMIVRVVASYAGSPA